MSTDENKAVVRRAFDSMSEGPDAFVAEHDQIYSDNTSGKRYGRPSTSIGIEGQPGVAVIISIPSSKAMQVSSTFDPVIEGFQAKACAFCTFSGLSGCATQSRVR